MIVYKKYYLPLLSVLIFCVLLAVGFNLAQRKPIWNDEILTQTQAIDQLSYGTIALGIIKGEGNNHPLFYLIQKAICDAARYRFPKPWEGEYLFADPHSQFIMRIGSNVFMSISLALIFYFFSWYYSVLAGIFALFVALLSAMTWIYWAEARPYSLWFLLSLMQSLLLLQFIRQEKARPKIMISLAVVHTLLALTTMASALQVGIASVFVFLFGRRPWRYYVAMTVVPLVLCFFYYLQSGKFMLALPASWGMLLSPHLAMDQIIFFSLYVLFLLFYAVKNKISGMQLFCEGELRAYLVFLLLMVGATLGYFWVQGFIHIEHPHNWIKDKYFLYLTPVVIIATVLFSVDLLKIFRKDLWMLTNVLLILAGFLVVRFFQVYLDISHANLILNYLGEYW